jgi:hypothetical protein
MNKKKKLKMALIFKESRDYMEYCEFFANMCNAYRKKAYFNFQDNTIYLSNNSIIKLSLRSDREDLSQFDILYTVGRHEKDASLIGLIDMIYRNGDIDFYELMNQKNIDSSNLYLYLLMSEREFYHFIDHELLSRHSLLNSLIIKSFDGDEKKCKQTFYNIKKLYWNRGYCCTLYIENIVILIVKDEQEMYDLFDTMGLSFRGRRKHENIINTDIVLSEFLKAIRI